MDIGRAEIVAGLLDLLPGGIAAGANEMLRWYAPSGSTPAMTRQSPQLYQRWPGNPTVGQSGRGRHLARGWNVWVIVSAGGPVP